jgi:hypothetical protein
MLTLKKNARVTTPMMSTVAAGLMLVGPPGVVRSRSRGPSHVIDRSVSVTESPRGTSGESARDEGFGETDRFSNVGSPSEVGHRRGGHRTARSVVVAR